MDCIFCSIIAHQSPASIHYEDETCIVFDSNLPVTPVHVLIVPKKHIPSLNDLAETDEAIIGHLFGVARRMAVELGIADRGYRVMINTGLEGGQTVFHIHLHLFGGRHLHFRFN